MKSVEEYKELGFSDEWIKRCVEMEEMFMVECELSYDGMDGVILIKGIKDDGIIYCCRDEELCFKNGLDNGGSMLEWCDGEMIIWEEDNEYNFKRVIRRL